MSALADSLLALEKRALGRTISLFEDLRPEAAEERRAVLEELGRRREARRALFVGVTGSPGSGKSTLVGELAVRLVGAAAGPSVAVLAVDPSSHVSGGALLGDRTRVRFPADEPRLFFRSQASDLALGGIGRATFQVCRLLAHLFDYVFVETVGIGQSEIDVRLVADWTYVVLQPLSGDEVQLMKAGVLEVPDAILLNKCDLGAAAEASYAAILGSAALGRPEGQPPPVHRISAARGTGLEEVVSELEARRARGARPLRDKEAGFLERWVREEYGRFGVSLLDERAGGAAAYLASAGSYDAAIRSLSGDLRRWLAG